MKKRSTRRCKGKGLSRSLGRKCQRECSRWLKSSKMPGSKYVAPRETSIGYSLTSIVSSCDRSWLSLRNYSRNGKADWRIENALTSRGFTIVVAMGKTMTVIIMCVSKCQSLLCRIWRVKRRSSFRWKTELLCLSLSPMIKFLMLRSATKENSACIIQAR